MQLRCIWPALNKDKHQTQLLLAAAAVAAVLLQNHAGKTIVSQVQTGTYASRSVLATEQLQTDRPDMQRPALDPAGIFHSSLRLTVSSDYNLGRRS